MDVEKPCDDACGVAEGEKHPDCLKEVDPESCQADYIMYDKIAPNNRTWLRIWSASMHFGMLLLVVAYVFYIVGLFQPILFLEEGELTDPEIFQPYSETLPHSLITLYNQQAYFTVAVAAIFSITLPFVKMFLMAVAYTMAIRHRQHQLRIFYGSTSRGVSPGSQEEDGYIKYTRDCLLILKLISKFQMVDVVILFLNIIYLRCAFLWVKAGPGLFCLILYCICSIIGAQMVNYAVEGERDIFQMWYAQRYCIFPNEIIDYYEGMENGKMSRWYQSEEFICLIVAFNILSCVSIMTNEKLMTVLFTVDLTKMFGVDSTSLTFREILVYIQGINLGTWAIFILFFLCIVIPMAMSILFLTGIFAYDQCLRLGLTARDVPDATENEQMQKEEHKWTVGYTRFIFCLCNFLSEWACGEVLALGTVAAYFSMTTAERVIAFIPPKKITSAMLMMVTYGISSFVLCSIFYIYNLRVKYELGDVMSLIKRQHLRYQSTAASDEKVDVILMEDASESIVDVEPRSGILLKCLHVGRMVLFSKILGSVFFGLLTVILLLLIICSYTMNSPNVYIQQNTVNGFLNKQLADTINISKRNIPKSYGHCDSPIRLAPAPCEGTGPLYYASNKSVFITFPWVTGLDTLAYNGGHFSISSDKRLTFTLDFVFHDLQILAQLGVCNGKQCKMLFNGFALGKGTDIGFSITASSSCKQQRPQLPDLRVDTITVENVKLTFLLHRLIHHYIDVQRFLADWLKYTANKMIYSNITYIKWRGIKMDIVEFANLMLVQNFPSDLQCPL
ncbi:Intermembrane transport protein PqiA-like [Babesia duncani]|uniref:Intermembrane transport protein PqiA-like n=1 Tax=Babesia duncani TaxID=323732 RepID=A0AAD9PMU0_9APIC|nr:Intermembrane transport protein PqiA-like [Babesia duncani]